MGPFWLVVNLEESDVEKKTWVKFCADSLLFLCRVLYLLPSAMK